MTPLPFNDPDLSAVARTVVWFEEPAVALADPVRFLAYAFAYATAEEMAVLKGFLTPDDFREALDNAPPGIIDPRSWSYWNLVYDRWPPPPLPQRRLP